VSTSASSSTALRIGAGLLALLFLIALAVLFAGIYLVVPDHYRALAIMGVIALIVGLLAYFAQALSRDPLVQRAVGWGFGASGFTLLFATIWLDPSQEPPSRLAWTLVLLVMLIAAVALALWRMRAVGDAERRGIRREHWAQSSPPSAFDYPAARSPGTTPGGAPPATPPPAPREL
jgi:peptidoglycan/LPS O-acetylase OafA/YrhL